MYFFFQNLLFYYDSETCNRPSGVVLLEGCYCEQLITTGTASKTKDGGDKQVSYRQYIFSGYVFMLYWAQSMPSRLSCLWLNSVQVRVFLILAEIQLKLNYIFHVAMTKLLKFNLFYKPKFVCYIVGLSSKPVAICWYVTWITFQ